MLFLFRTNQRGKIAESRHFATKYLQHLLTERGTLIKVEIKCNKDIVIENVNLIVKGLKRSDKAIFSNLKTLYTGTSKQFKTNDGRINN